MIEEQDTKSIVLSRLKALETEHEIKIVYACESGSRGWGFPSPDSDYDVRFLYVRTPDWYMSIRRGRDVIEPPIVDDFDINGWDIQKALGLLHRSNPSLLEWLGSPIVYLEDECVVNALREASRDFWCPTTCFLYYRNKAAAVLEEHRKSQGASIKQFFYILRPLVAIRWLERFSEVVPTDFNVVASAVIDDPALLADIQSLVRLKKTLVETKVMPSFDSIDSFIKAEMSRLAMVHPAKVRPRPIAPLDELFRRLVRKCWS
jgi:predicted nucleotidyltransferase